MFKGQYSHIRSPGGHRYFLKQDLDKLFGQKYIRTAPAKPRETKSEPTPQPEKVSLVDDIPQKVTQDITPSPQLPVEAVEEEIKPKPPEPTAIQQRQDLEIKARDLIRTPQPTPEPKKNKIININFGEIPWSKILLIGIVLFVIADLILLAVYLTSSRPLVSPIP